MGNISEQPTGASNVPDRLEGDHATSDSIRADLHDVYLACDSAKSATSPGKGHLSVGDAYWRTPIPAPLQSFARACNKLSLRTNSNSITL